MKKLHCILPALLLWFSVGAQNPTAYFMEGSTLRSAFNPAFAPLRGYVNIPVLGGLDINISGNMSLDNVLFPVNGKLVTLLDSAVPATLALDGLSPSNLLGLDSRINLIGVGAFTRNSMNFWSFDINIRGNAGVDLPYEFFEFFKRGTSADISKIRLEADSYLEAAFGYSFPVCRDKLYIGLRGKMLLGVARAKMDFDRFAVSLDQDRWQVDASGLLDMTAAGIEIDSQPNQQGQRIYQLGDLSLKPTSPAGYGFALDLGLVWDILPNLQASAAATDLGLICWSKSKNQRGSVNKTLIFEGVTIDTEEGTQQPKFDLGDIDFEQDAQQSLNKMLRATINLGLEYEIWRHKIGLGVLYTARLWEYQTLHNITGSINFHPVRWFTLTGSYSVIDNRGHAVGLGLNLNTNWINFFLATDMATVHHTPQFVPIQQRVMHLTLGLGVPIGRRSHRVPTYVYTRDKR